MLVCSGVAVTRFSHKLGRMSQRDAELPKSFLSAALRLMLPFSAVLVLLSAALITLRIENVVLDLAQGRGLRAAHQLRDQIEGGFRLGLGLGEQTNLPLLLERQRSEDDRLIGAFVSDEHGLAVAHAGDEGARARVQPAWHKQVFNAPSGSIAGPTVRTQGSWLAVGVSAQDASGQPAAAIWLVYDRQTLRDGVWRAMAPLWIPALLATVLLAMALSVLIATWLTRARARQTSRETWLARLESDAQSPPPDAMRPIERMALISAALLASVAALGAVVWQARSLSEPLVARQIEQNAKAVLNLARSQIERALVLGVPAASLNGLEALFRAELIPAPEVAFLAYQGDEGRISAFTPHAGLAPELEASARSWLRGQDELKGFRAVEQPVSVGVGQQVGRLVAGTPLNYIDARLRSLLADIGVGLVIGLILAREALSAAWSRSPLRQLMVRDLRWARTRAAAPRSPEGVDAPHALAAQHAQGDTSTATAVHAIVARVRLVVFLTALSDELLRPFFTVFAADLPPPWPGMTPAMVAALPVAGFMLMLAVAQPLGPWITRHVTARHALLGTALTGAVLLLATPWAQDGLSLMALRSASGMVYGLMLILVQSVIVRVTSERSRARGLVEVSAAIVAAGICGPVLGGVVVERFGVVAAFAACASCLLGAALAIWSLRHLPEHGAAPAWSGWRGLLAAMTNHRVAGVTWFAAVPARLAAAALLVVVTPLYLASIGETAVVTGRVLLLYFLCFMLCAPLVALWSDKLGRREPWVVAGCLISTLSCALMPALPGTLGAALCCALLGVGQALMSAPMLALVTESVRGEAAAGHSRGATAEQALAAFRLVERVGSVAAPFVVAAVASRYGLAAAAVAIGSVLGVGALGTMWTLRARPAKPGD